MSKPGVQQGSSYASVHKQTRYFSTAITCLQNNHRHMYKPLPCQHLSIAPLHFLPLANQIMKMPRLMEYIEYIYMNLTHAQFIYLYYLRISNIISSRYLFQCTVSICFNGICTNFYASNFMQIETSNRLF